MHCKAPANTQQYATSSKFPVHKLHKLSQKYSLYKMLHMKMLNTKLFSSYKTGNFVRTLLPLDQAPRGIVLIKGRLHFLGGEKSSNSSCIQAEK